jgi:type 1 fimbria pilin
VENTNRNKGKTMICSLSLTRCVARMLSVMLVLSATAAQAQKSVLEVHGVITSPACSINIQTLAQLSQQHYINGQACGLTSGATNPLSSLNIAQIDKQTLPTSLGTADRQLVTLTYR